MLAIDREINSSGPSLQCACCEMQVSERGNLCPHCEMPLEVSRGVRDRGAPARFVSVIGPSGAGKTVYLGMLLDMLSKGCGELRGLPNGPFSLTLQQQAVSALAGRRFPEKTPTESDNWNWVHCQITKAKQKSSFLDMITPDVAGEAIALEVERADSFPVIRTVLARSAAVMLLIDSYRCRESGRTEDMFAMKVLSYLFQLYERIGQLKKKKVAIPIAIVFTKSDMCPEVMVDTREFAAAALPGLSQTCEARFLAYDFFATGLVGSHAYGVDGLGRRVQVPLHVEPRGVTAPLQWAFSKIFK